MPRTDIQIQSLMVATDIDVLPDTSHVEDRGAYVVVRTPTNPSYHWGNFLLFREPPKPGDREQWEAAFEAEFGTEREYRHCAICWDRPGEEGAARTEFVETAGYDPDPAVALVAQPHELVEHPRMNRDVTVTALDPDGDDALWAGLLELQVLGREPGHSEADYRPFAEARMADRRKRFRAGDGAWFVAQLADGTIAGSCGVVVTQGRGRYQAVDTHPDHRRLGIATRVVYDAGRAAIDEYGAEHLVIAADAEYHALPLYESLGFVARERMFAVCWWPGAPRAAEHPRWGSLARPVS
ncbi:MAG: N-acetyltransferase [Thermoleophilia bacterium]|nr:N-acetyltransferase [Thermoleophilia bacterium]